MHAWSDNHPREPPDRADVRALGCSGRLAGLAWLRCNQLMGVRCAAGCWVLPVRRRAPARHHLCLRLRRFLVAVLRILGVRSTPSSPSFVGACGPQNQLRRSCVAYFLRRFRVPCPAGRQGSVGRRASKLASNQKTTGGEEVAGRVPQPPYLVSMKQGELSR
jgi:hypothetical protein